MIDGTWTGAVEAFDHVGKSLGRAECTLEKGLDYWEGDLTAPLPALIRYALEPEVLLTLRLPNGNEGRVHVSDESASQTYGVRIHVIGIDAPPF